MTNATEIWLLSCEFIDSLFYLSRISKVEINFFQSAIAFFFHFFSECLNGREQYLTFTFFSGFGKNIWSFIDTKDAKLGHENFFFRKFFLNVAKVKTNFSEPFLTVNMC
jgi:hypothetical protein